MYCLNCKTEFFSGNKLCPDCGKRGSKRTDGKKSVEFSTVVKWGVLLLIIFFVVGFFVSSYENKKNREKGNAGIASDSSDNSVKPGN